MTTQFPLAAAAAGTYTSGDLINDNNSGANVVFDATVATTTSAVLTIEGKDPISGKYYAILTGAAVTGVTTNVYQVYPGLAAVANAQAGTRLPHTWRIKVVVTGGSSALTATVGAEMLR